ncbi:MAG TPA: [NiFe]-hydrogenase assembly chaperone HybE [Rhodoblastus sp.]|nr:[NiFe]-hydrogenase assembly chaperone HybE [Rhodoblastus sp.]
MDEAERLAACARLAEGLEAHFRAVHAGAMRDVPICNENLDVACLGFRPLGDWAVGLIVTPWFMNLFAAPLVGALATAPGETQRLALPAGDVDFLAGDFGAFGRLLVCSLFSPMDEFADQAAALATAQAAFDMLLTLLAPPPERPAARMDRRAFFRGGLAREAAS